MLFFISATYDVAVKPYELKIPIGFPKPLIPEDNQLTVDRVLLGKKLFYDKILSSDQTISCASCHAPDFSFSDNKAFSNGVGDEVGERNSMPLINLAWSNSFFWDGGVTSLEIQVFKPLTSHKEMNLQLDEAIARLNSSKEYRKYFKKAYGCEPDANSLFKAIACFERTLISGNSKFDQFFYKKDTSVFNESEKRGYLLFFGEGKVHCASCHSGVNFTNHTFQNNGLYKEFQDEGREKVTGKRSDIGKFKVPTLRNISYTAPYMHDGSIKTLDEVVQYYSTGGSGHFNESMHVHIEPGFELTEQDKIDLVNFLKALNDEKFIENPEFRN